MGARPESLLADGGRLPPGAKVLLAAAVLAGCSAGAPGASPAAPAAATSEQEESSRPRSSPNVLTGDEVRATGSTTLWDAVRQLRPQWLRARGSSSLVAPLSSEPIVYLHGIHHGPLRSLQQMNVDRVRRVEFMDATSATTRFGTNHAGGVILVDLDRS